MLITDNGCEAMAVMLRHWSAVYLIFGLLLLLPCLLNCDIKLVWIIHAFYFSTGAWVVTFVLESAQYIFSRCCFVTVHVLMSLLWMVCSSFVFPTRSLGFTIFGEIFVYVTGIFYPTIEVVTLHLRDCWVCSYSWHWPTWDMNVRILWVHLAGCRCAQTRPPFILSSESFVGSGVRTSVISKEKITSTRGLQGGSNELYCIMQDSKPNTLPTELFWPQ